MNDYAKNLKTALKQGYVIIDTTCGQTTMSRVRNGSITYKHIDQQTGNLLSNNK